MRWFGYILIFVVLCIMLIIVLFPLIMVALNSFKTEAEYMNSSPLSLPKHFSLDVIRAVWKEVDFTNKFINSVILSIATAVITVVISLLNGYALSVLKVPGRILILFAFMLGMMIPQEALVYPLYYLFKQIGIYNKQISVILILAGFHAAFGTYLVATVLKSFPSSYIDAAKIDGCSKFSILWRIVFPISKSVISVLWVFAFIWTWNDFFISLVFLVSNKIQTMPLGMIVFQGQHRVSISLRGASALITAMPCVAFFFIFMRTISRGIISTGIKE